MEPKDDFFEFFSPSFSTLMNKIKNTNPSLFMEKFHAIHENLSFYAQTINSSNLKFPQLDEDGINFMLENDYDFLKPILTDLSSDPISNTVKGNNLNTYHSILKNTWGISSEFKQNGTEFIYINKETQQSYPVTLLNDYVLNIVPYLSAYQHQKIIFFTEKLLEQNPQVIKNMPKNGFFLLHHAVKHKNTGFMELLYKNGFDSSLVDNFGKKVSDYAASDAQLYSFYLEMENKYGKLTESQNATNFQTQLSLIKSQTKKLTKQDKTSEEKIFTVYVDALKNASSKEKEELIATALCSYNSSLFKKILKHLKIKLENYSPEHFPLWKTLPNMGNQDCFYLLMDHYKDKGNPLTYYQDPKTNAQIQKILDEIEISDISLTKNKNYFVVNLFEFFDKIGCSFNFTDDAYRYSKSSKNIRDSKINSILKPLFTLDFLLDTNSHHSNKINWFQTFNELGIFEKCATNFHLFNFDSPCKLKENFDLTQSEEKYEYTLQILENTIFTPEYKKHLQNHSDAFLIQNNVFIGYLLEGDDIQSKLEKISLENKVFLFSYSLKFSGYGNYYTRVNSLIDHLSENLSSNSQFTFDMLHLDEQKLDTIKKQSPSRYSLLSKMQLEESLKDDSKVIKEVRKMKL